MKWYLKVLKQYADFEGRARREEYWMFLLFNIIFGGVAFAIDMILMKTIGFSIMLYAIYSLALLIPGIAVTVRRLHDVGKSGWWIFIGLIPLIGGIWLIVLEVTDSVPGENEYGPNPKGVQ